MLISFQNFNLLTEGFGKEFAKKMLRKFSEFKNKPTFSHDGKIIRFKGLSEIDKDSILVGLTELFKEFKKIKHETGSYADYKANDDTFYSIKPPKKEGNKFSIKIVAK